MMRDGWLLVKLVARLLATAALWVRIQASLKNAKWATYSKRRSGQHTLARQKIYKKTIEEERVGKTSKVAVTVFNQKLVHHKTLISAHRLF
jgi:hypothetical protein